MPYAYNRSAFAAGLNNSSCLLSIYSTLVIVELGLKEYLGVRGNGLGHDLGIMLKKAIPPSSPRYSTAAIRLRQLRMCLGGLRCNRKDGSPNFVRHQAYPDLRYVRHEQDWPKDSSNNDQLVQVQQAANRFRQFCREIGIPTQ